MTSHKFNDYCEVRDFIAICEEKSIEIEPFVERLQELAIEHRFDELLQTVKNAANWAGRQAGNLAQGASKAAGMGWGALQNTGNNMVKAFQTGQSMMGGMAPNNQAGQQQGQQSQTGQTTAPQTQQTTQPGQQQTQQGTSPQTIQQVKQLQQTLQTAGKSLETIMKGLQQ